jgi:tetratricopeptide (TPR) repeat protein
MVKYFYILFLTVCALSFELAAQKPQSSMLKCVEAGVYDISGMEEYAKKIGDNKLHRFAVLINGLKDEDSLSTSEKFLKAEAYAAKFKDETDKNILLSTVYIRWGNFFKERGCYAAAQEKFNAGLNFVINAVNKKHECMVFLACAESVVASFEILVKNFPKARLLCEEAESIFSDERYSSLNTCIEGKATILNSHGIVCAEIPQYLSAKKKYTEALELYNMLETRTSKCYDYEKATVYNNLGVLFDNAGSLEEALLNYTLAEKLLERYSKSNQSVMTVYAKLLTDKGNLFRKLSLPDSAAVCLEKALKIFSEKNSFTDGERVQLSTLYNNLAVLNRSEKNYEKADEFYTESYKIRKELAQKSDSYLGLWAEVLTDYGMFCVDNADIDLAVYYLEQAALTREKIVGTDPRDENKNALSESYDNLAYVCLFSGDTPGAKKNYELSGQMRRWILASDPGVYLDSYYNTLSNLASIYNKEENFEAAINILSTLRETLEQYSDTSTEDFYYKSAVTDYNLALTYDYAGKKSVAYAVMKEAYNEISKVSGRQSGKFLTETGEILLQLGNCAFDSGDFVSAELYYEKAVAIRTSLAKKNIISYASAASALNNLGLLYYALNKHEKADESFFKAQKLFETISEEDYDIEAATAYAKTAINIAECTSKNRDKNRELLQHAGEILKPFTENSSAGYYYEYLQKVLANLKK